MFNRSSEENRVAFEKFLETLSDDPLDVLMVNCVFLILLIKEMRIPQVRNEAQLLDALEKLGGYMPLINNVRFYDFMAKNMFDAMLFKLLRSVIKPNRKPDKFVHNVYQTVGIGIDEIRAQFLDSKREGFETLVAFDADSKELSIALLALLRRMRAQYEVIEGECTVVEATAPSCSSVQPNQRIALGKGVHAYGARAYEDVLNHGSNAPGQIIDIRV